VAELGVDVDAHVPAEPVRIPVDDLDLLDRCLPAGERLIVDERLEAGGGWGFYLKRVLGAVDSHKARQATPSVAATASGWRA
jgi:hypothetical protein